jgi:20S proteasome alpha/beta subunit
MTVCIAVETESTIFAVFDEMLSASDFSADHSAMKLKNLYMEKWWTMFASSKDAGIIDPLANKLRAEFRKCRPSTVDEASSCCVAGFGAQLRETAERTILTRYNLTIDQFVRQGLQYFGPAMFTDLKEQIEQITLGIELLVFGFDKNGNSHIFTVADPGECYYRDVTCKWAIGSGAWTAIGVLMRDPLLIHHEREEIIYSICEAKFLAETALGVGKETQLFVLEKSGKFRLYFSHELRGVRSVWQSLGRPVIPAQAIDAIRTMIAKSPLIASE